jgi:hypothetical protein
MWEKKRRNVKAPTHSLQVMVRSAISSRGATPLIFIKGSVNSQKYIEILEAFISTTDFLYPDGYIFQQDKASCHKSRIAKMWFEDNRVVVMDWPTMSPDDNRGHCLFYLLFEL